VITVIVGEEDVTEREAHPVAHHLALGTLAAIEQEHLPFPLHGETGDVPVDGGTGGAGPEEGD
jgi:hypothetical protein